MTQDQKTQHTPGRLGRNIPPITKYPVLYAGRNTHVAQVVTRGISPEESEKNADLIVAAWNSYDKHCGPRAVECAEADLLGEALKALREIHEIVKGPLPWDKREVNFNRAKIAGLCIAISAKASGEPKP